MAIPTGAMTCGYVADPADVLDYVIDVRGEMAGNGDGRTEFISNDWQLGMSAEGAAAGVQIRTDRGRSPEILLGSGGVRFWLGVDPLMQDDAMFEGAGISVPLTFEWGTTNEPPRTIKLTAVVTIRVR